MARVKAHAKVHVSVAHHPKTQDVWADPAQRGMLVEVWRLAMERYAAKRGDMVSLRPLDRLSITACTSLEDADLVLSSLFKALKYRVRRHPNRWDVHIRNYAKKHGIDTSELTDESEKNRTHKKKKKKKREEEEVKPAPIQSVEGYEQPNEVTRMLRLNARATDAERSVWAESVWVEVVAAAQIESRWGGSFRDHFVKILSARWNAYLRERDPTRRQFAREAELRATVEARERAEGTALPLAPVPSEPDPLEEFLAARVAGGATDGG